MSIDVTERLRLYREAAELTGDAMEATDQTERERLLAKAKLLTDRAEQGADRDSAATLAPEASIAQKPLGRRSVMETVRRV